VGKRRRRLALGLFVAFIVMPLIELYVIIRVGSWIGVLPTIGLLVLDSILGTWLIKREGARAWQALRERIETGRMPHRELADGALIVLGGALMLSPGFVTDVFGVLLILPVTRPLFRRLVLSYAGNRVVRGAANATGGAPGGPGAPPGDVVRGDVVD
jgi:UPF0716 protein FxsA